MKSEGKHFLTFGVVDRSWDDGTRGFGVEKLIHPRGRGRVAGSGARVHVGLPAGGRVSEFVPTFAISVGTSRTFQDVSQLLHLRTEPPEDPPPRESPLRSVR